MTGQQHLRAELAPIYKTNLISLNNAIAREVPAQSYYKGRADMVLFIYARLMGCTLSDAESELSG